MKNLLGQIAISVVAATGMMACAAEAPDPTLQTSAQVQDTRVTCTPGQETCDAGCFFQGGPSTDDCIIRCNAAGTGWITLEDCGWAQNFPFSASCKNTQPHPVCENN